jgi:hypothetical protein
MLFLQDHYFCEIWFSSGLYLPLITPFIEQTSDLKQIDVINFKSDFIPDDTGEFSNLTRNQHEKVWGALGDCTCAPQTSGVAMRIQMDQFKTLLYWKSCALSIIRSGLIFFQNNSIDCDVQYHLVATIVPI